MWLASFFRSLFGSSGKEKPSPSDIVPKGSILVSGGVVTLDLTKINIPLDHAPNVWAPSIVANTNSLDPVIDVGNNNILIQGATAADHRRILDFASPGDMGVYRFPADLTLPTQVFINHRVVEKGKDGKGRFWRFKGDNNAQVDPYVVRDENFQWLCVGVVY